MKNNYLWGLLILVAVIFGAILLGLSSVGYDSMQYANKTSENKTATTKTSTTNNTPKKTTPTQPIEGMKTSLGGIFNEQGSYQCDYDSITQQTRTSNVVYISGGKLRGEFRTTTAQGTQSNIAVYDGSNLYVWVEGKTIGTMTQPKTLADLPGIIPEDVSSGKILGTGLSSVSWNCHAWSKDSTKLMKPAYVTFN